MPNGHCAARLASLEVAGCRTGTAPGGVLCSLPSGEYGVGAHELVHEAVRGKAQTGQRDPENDVTVEGHLVLSQRVVDRVEGQLMMAAVDLDHQPDAIPRQVEVDPPVGGPAHDLSGRLWQAAGAAQGSDVQLAKGVRAVADVLHDDLNESAASRPAQGFGGSLQVCGPHETLLDDETEEQHGLTVAHGPSAA